MARETARLNALQVKNLTKPGYYCDGAGLYLQVSKTGSKSWIMRYTLDGKPCEMGLGSLTAFPLAEARQRATAQRKLLADGINPLAKKQADVLARRMADASIITFDKAAAAFIQANSPAWRNAKHGDQWRNTLATYASPVIGALPVSKIETAHILRILSPIWATKTETATRVRGRIEKILDWAKVQGYRTGDNPAAWRGHLSEALPKPSKVADAGHHAALAWAEIGAFMVALRAAQGAGARAMELIILTATRTSEVLNAKWAEFDLDAGMWIIPKERMKGFREHRVPLSAAALAVLDKAKAESTGGEYVFAGSKRAALSNMTCLATLKRMGRSDLTVHGFRSTFRDWVSESTSYPRDVAEMALAHAIEDKSEAAYRRGDLIEKRRALMSDWAAHCAVVRVSGDVVAIRAKVAA
ncbi:MAG: site-specific integrase [Polaromonas sp.]|nr:site-specific integrase [Polaromonas sp.]